MSDNAIEATGLTRTFKSVDAVRGIDLAVRSGEVFGFLGPNGAGKSTTVRMLCTLLPPTTGSAVVAGHDVVAEPSEVRRRIGVAMQEIGLDPIQTGAEIIRLQCGLYGLRGAAAKTRARELLALVGLTEAADRRVKTYSGGMKRRLDLATALVHDPSVLFLDEPTTGLDPASRNTIWDEVRRINRTGTTVFLTTQYMEEADQLCDRLAIIDNGRIVAEGTPEQLKAKLGNDVVDIELGGEDRKPTVRVVRDVPAVEHVTESETGVAAFVSGGAQAVPAIVLALGAAGITPRSVTISRPTLDDVFLEATGRRLEGAAEVQA